MRSTEKMKSMIPEAAAEYLKIRYLKLHFSLEILEEGIMPRQKASALRGGMGRMLLLSNCIRDENCASCDFEEDCLVRRMMYPKMEIRPAFMTQEGRDSEGYVLECENTEEEFLRGDILEFQLILFGRTIVYFTQFLQAFHYLGMQGLGKHHLPFRIRCVTNSTGRVVVEGSNVYKENLQIMQVEDYVRYRLSRLSSGRPGHGADGSQTAKEEGENQGTEKPQLLQDESSGESSRLVFHSPLTLKHKGRMQKQFSSEALLAALERRLFILNCFEGHREGEDFHRILVQNHIPDLLGQRTYMEKVTRYSGTHDSKVSFTGIKGYCDLAGIDAVTKALLIAGELVHIGKNTSFGFGRYTLV